MKIPKYDQAVFINCPFDTKYNPILEALVFAVQDCGYVARTALERRDSVELRMDKLVSIIRDCRFGIHDISRTQLDAKSRLPRFNMPMELALFLGARVFGKGKNKRKVGLILDSKPFQYQVDASDLAGFDGYSHENKPEEAIKQVRDWLNTYAEESSFLPSGPTIVKRYAGFRGQLPSLCSNLGLDSTSLHFRDYSTLVAQWLKRYP